MVKLNIDSVKKRTFYAIAVGLGMCIAKRQGWIFTKWAGYGWVKAPKSFTYLYGYHGTSGQLCREAVESEEFVKKMLNKKSRLQSQAAFYFQPFKIPKKLVLFIVDEVNCGYKGRGRTRDLGDKIWQLGIETFLSALALN